MQSYFMLLLCACFIGCGTSPITSTQSPQDFRKTLESIEKQQPHETGKQTGKR